MELSFTTYVEPMDIEHLQMWIDRLPPDSLGRLAGSMFTRPEIGTLLTLPVNAHTDLLTRFVDPTSLDCIFYLNPQDGR
jgi:hypothetical protein